MNVRRSLDPICVFLGAGADISSGGITFHEFKLRCFREFVSREGWEVAGGDLETLFSDLIGNAPEHIRASAVELMFRAGTQGSAVPSDGYKLLVLLASLGVVSAIITTNFDVMLETAQRQIGHSIFQVYSPGVARPYPLGSADHDNTRVPYIKLHGDLGAQAVTLLTQEELAKASYDPETIEAVKRILGSHHVVFIGYSGYDGALAKLAAPSILASGKKVFWCGPAGPAAAAPLVAELGLERIVPIRETFDAVIEAMAEDALRRPTAAGSTPAFIRSLFEWRLRFTNEVFEKSVLPKEGSQILAKRPAVEQQIRTFLKGHRPLAVVTAPSGYGKSALGVRLAWALAPRSPEEARRGGRRVLLLRAKEFDGTDIEQHIFDCFGIYDQRTSTTLRHLENWLIAQSIDLVVYIDGLNELDGGIEAATRLFNSIVRFAFVLRDNGPIRMVATIRGESWRTILGKLKGGRLGWVLWNAEAEDFGKQAITLDILSDDELREAIDKLRARGKALPPFDWLSPPVRRRLRDPYLLACAAELAPNQIPSSLVSLLPQVINLRLAQPPEGLTVNMIRDALAMAAFAAFRQRRTMFRREDLGAARPAERFLHDSGLVVTDGPWLRFDHERTFEFFLSEGMALEDLDLDSFTGMAAFVLNCFEDKRALAAARLYYLHDPQRFEPVKEALRWLDMPRPGDAKVARFAKGVLLEGIDNGVQWLAGGLVEDLLDRKTGEFHGRTLVHAAARLMQQDALAILGQASASHHDKVRSEAATFALDLLARHFFETPTPNCWQDEPYRTFLSAPDGAGWQALARLFGLASRIGPDNCSEAEYSAFKTAVGSLMAEIRSTWQREETEKGFMGTLSAHALDRYLFNADAAEVAAFFHRSSYPHDRVAAHGQLRLLLDRLADGGTVTPEDFSTLVPFLDLHHPIEYQLCNCAFLMSAANDFNRTKAVCREIVDGQGAHPPPVLIDFINGVLAYIHVAANRPFEIDDEWLTRRICEDWPEVLLYQQGDLRGRARGFSESHEMRFEDGFNPVSTYALLAPARRRSRMSFAEYSQLQHSPADTPLPLFSEYLRQFLDKGKIEAALRIIHAIGQAAALWPAESLSCLAPCFHHQDPRIHWAVMRLLAESLARHPQWTERFIAASGIPLTEDELFEVQKEGDHRVANRQFETVEWGRIIALLTGNLADIRLLVEVTHALLKEASLADALARLQGYLLAVLPGRQ